MEDATGSPQSDDFLDIYGSPTRDNPAPNSPAPSSAMDRRPKRTLPDESSQQPEKRQKTEAQHLARFPEAVARLPAEIWQNIFKQLPPLMLCRLLRVNRAFHRYLSDSKAYRWLDRRKDRLQILDAENVWSDTRKLHYPTMPRPLINCSEKDMWKLILGQDCMSCGSLPKPRFPPERSFQNGPGSDGVRIIWPFATRVCGPCLERHSQREAALLFSSSPLLLQALPFVIVTEDWHVVPSPSAQDFAGPSTFSPVAKLFYKPHIEQIECQLRDTKALGQAAAEEWSKGLAATGKEKMLDAARWERYEMRGGLESIRHDVFTRSFVRETSILSQGQSSRRSTMTPSSASVIVQASRSTRDSSIPHSISQHGRTGRNIQDVNQSKALKRAEIEHRCELLQPPITRNVLQYMESFRAALQIPSALTDDVWNNMLLPRLQAQRPEAERLALEAATKGKDPLSRPDRRGNQHPDSKEAMDQEWDEHQTPIRDRLGRCADWIITRSWQNGNAVTHANCPSFATDVLSGSRELYYSDFDHGNDAASSRSPLVLDNMKWIFDLKIKPFTEKFRREIFLCHDCVTSKKYYGFEAVLQHYGAKHTNSFTVGTGGLAWRDAKWPEHSPFHPNPANLSNGNGSMHHRQHRNTWNSNRSAAYQPQMNFGAPPGYEFSPSPVPWAMSQVSPGPSRAVPLPSNSQWMSPKSLTAHGNSLAQIRPPGGQTYYPSLSNVAAPPPPSTSQMFKNSATQFVNAQQPSQAIDPGQVDPPSSMHGSWPQAPFDSRIDFASALDDSRMDTQHQEDLHGSPDISNGRFSGHRTRSDQNELEVLSEVAINIWFLMAGVNELPISLRVYILIFHMGQTSRSRSGKDLDLDLFERVIHQCANVAPIANAAGLACRMCAHQGDELHKSYSSRINKRELLSLSSLVRHYLQAHISEPVGHKDFHGSAPDWKELMIELPEPDLINDLENAPGMTAERKRLFSQVFPFARESKSVSKAAKVSYDDQYQGYISSSQYHDANANGRNALEDPHAGSRASLGSRHFEPFAKIPRAESTLPSTFNHSEAELGNRLNPLPTNGRYHHPGVQYQARLQEMPSRARPLHTEDDYPQSSEHVARENPPENYQRRPTEGFLYLTNPELIANTTPVFDDAGFHCGSEEARSFIRETAQEDAPLVQYVSRSKDWNPDDEESGASRLLSDNASSDHQSTSSSRLKQYLSNGSHHVPADDTHLPSTAEQADNRIHPPSSENSESFRLVRFPSNTEGREYHPTPVASHITSVSRQADPRQGIPTNSQPRQPSAYATPTRAREQPSHIMVRSLSRRFERYEAARRHLDRTASQSPAQRQSVPVRKVEHQGSGPPQPNQQQPFIAEDRSQFAGDTASYAQMPRTGERREYYIRVPVESSDEHENARLGQENLNTYYEAPRDVVYYNDQNIQGAEYVRYRLESPQERGYEQQRVRYVPEHELVRMERIQRNPEDTGASLPPNVNG